MWPASGVLPARGKSRDPVPGLQGCGQRSPVEDIALRSRHEADSNVQHYPENPSSKTSAARV